MRPTALTLPSDILACYQNSTSQLKTIYVQNRNGPVFNSFDKAVRRRSLSFQCLRQLVVIIRDEIRATSRADFTASQRLGLRLPVLRQCNVSRFGRHVLIKTSTIVLLIQLLPSLLSRRCSPAAMELPRVMLDVLSLRHWLPFLQPCHICNLVTSIAIYHNMDSSLPRHVVRRLQVLADVMGDRPQMFSSHQVAVVARAFNQHGVDVPSFRYNCMIHLVARAFGSANDLHPSRSAAMEIDEVVRRATPAVQINLGADFQLATHNQHERLQCTVLRDYPLSVVSSFFNLLWRGDSCLVELLMIRIYIGLHSKEYLSFTSALEILNSLEGLVTQQFEGHVDSQLECDLSLIPFGRLIIPIFRGLLSKLMTNHVLCDSKSQFALRSLKLLCLVKSYHLSLRLATESTQHILEYLYKYLSVCPPTLSVHPYKFHSHLAFFSTVVDLLPAVAVPSCVLHSLEHHLRRSIRGLSLIVGAHIISKLNFSAELMEEALTGILNSKRPESHSVKVMLQLFYQIERGKSTGYTGNLALAILESAMRLNFLPETSREWETLRRCMVLARFHDNLLVQEYCDKITGVIQTFGEHNAFQNHLS